MDINWSEIKEEMRRDFGDIFQTNSPSFINFADGINLFQKVIYQNVSSFDLGGLQRMLPQALNEAYTTKIGQIPPLRVIADSLEPYLKKLSIIANLDSPSSIMQKELMPLLKMLNLNSALTTQTKGGFPQLNANNLQSFKGAPEYLEYICDAYLTRNKVHDSPDWNRIEVLDKLRNILVVYVYAALRYKTAIEASPDNRPSERLMNEKIDNNQKYLYDFISFGSTTNKIRNQIVASYILNYLKDNQSITIEQLKTGVNSFFTSELQIGYYQKIVQKLLTDKKVEVTDQKLQLTPEELKRINSVQKNFEENRNIFFLFLEDIAKKYCIVNSMSELFDRLKDFIESNYNIDIAEAFNTGADIDKDENQAYQNFIAFLQDITGDKVIAGKLFKDLIELSNDSDFLIRMCASKAFATLTNPDRFEQYIHQQEKIVYLDTQIILHALCLNYVTKASYDNFYYQATEELIDLAHNDPCITLKVSRLYLQEVAYQLKLALLLIPFEEVGKGRLSSNVFYQFYWYLKEAGMLDEEDKTFADFMKSWFRLYEEDAYEPRFWTIAFNNLYDFLEDSALNIEIETLPIYDNKNEAVEVLNSVLDRENYKHRPKHSVDNDAIMICHLCSPEPHNAEPFFLSWDKAFIKFRKEFLRRYERNNVYSFHLFSPPRFINHYSLIRLKINPTAITNEFISIMDSNSIHEDTQTLWDAVNKFLNIDNINSQKRRKYLFTIKTLLENELDYTFDDFEDTEKTNKVLTTFEEMITRVNEYYSSNSKFQINDYRDLLTSEEYFEVASKLIFEAMNDTVNQGQLFIELDGLISKYKTGSTAELQSQEES